MKTEIVGKRNDSRVNRHQQVQLQGWRANCDIQLIIDHHACIEYLAKYASKAEKMSSVARDTFVSVVNNLQDDSCPKSAIRKLMMKSVGERDMGIQEVMHHILSLKLYRSSFNVITVSLDNSSKCKISKDELSVSKSELEIYCERLDYSNDLIDTNLISFISEYIVRNGKLHVRKEPVIVRTIPNYSSNPKGNNYGQYCKYQLIKYKPWAFNIASLWSDEEESDLVYISHWQVFLESDLGRHTVSDWQRHLQNAEKYLNDSEDNDEILGDTSYEQSEEWMLLAKMAAHTNNVPEIDKQHIQAIRAVYSNDLINAMPFWLENERGNLEESCLIDGKAIDISTFNDKQLLAYSIIQSHQSMMEKPLYIMITGQGGSGKSFVINAVRSLLQSKCIVASCFGIAAFNIQGVTLHSLLRLPIRGKNNCDLKGTALAKLQMRLKDVKYIIIDEFSVIGQKMLGWIDRRCRQATGEMDKTFWDYTT